MDGCIWMDAWCSKKRFRKECPVLGADIFTNNPRVCHQYKFWQDKPCFDDYIRCMAGYSGQCVWKGNWGHKLSCKDGSDLYRPIVKGEEPVRPVCHIVRRHHRVLFYYSL